MRYILIDGYIDEVSFDNNVECKEQTCTAYTGSIPAGYNDIEEWYKAEADKLNAWKIVDGNLVFDAVRNAELQAQFEQQDIDNSTVYHKELYGMQQQIEQIQNVNDSQYQKAILTGKVISTTDAKACVPNITLAGSGAVDLVVTNANMLPNEATSMTLSGIDFTQNEDRSIAISGTATADIEYNIAGTSNNASAFLCFKKDIDYCLEQSNQTIKMYYYDGTNRTEIYSGKGGKIKFTDSDKLVTQIVVSISNGTTICETIYPMLSKKADTSENHKISMTKDNVTGKYYLDGVSTQETRSGKNMLNVIFGGTIENHGLTFTQNEDNSININGTSTATIYFNISVLNHNDFMHLAYFELKNGYTYTSYLKGNPGNINLITRSNSQNTRLIHTSLSELNTQVYNGQTDSLCWCYLQIFSGCTFNNVTVYPMIMEGTYATTTPYEPYGAMPSPDYPSEIVNTYQAGTYQTTIDNKVYVFTLEDDLRSVGEIADRLWLDTTNNSIEVVKNIGNKIFDGSESYSSGTLTNTYILMSSTITPTIPNIVTTNTQTNNLFSKVYWGYNYDNESYYETNSQFICKVNKALIDSQTGSTIVEKWKNYLATTNWVIYYQLATSTTTSGVATTNDINYVTYKSKSLHLEEVEDVCNDTFTLFNEYNNVYTMQDIELSMEYCINNLALEGTITKNNNFKILEDGSIEANNGNFSGKITATSGSIGGYTINATDLTANVNWNLPFSIDTLEEINYHTSKINNYVNGTGNLTNDELIMYDVNNDGIVDKLDILMILRIYYGYIITNGKLKINSGNYKETIAFTDTEDNVINSFGLNGLISNYISSNTISSKSINTNGREIGHGELLAYAVVEAQNGTTPVANGVNIAFSDTSTGTKTYEVTNYVEGILTGQSGAVLINTQGLVGMIEVTCVMSGKADANTSGIMWNGVWDELPNGVTLYGSSFCLTTGPCNYLYGGSSNSYFYDVSSDQNLQFYINPKFAPYGGAITFGKDGLKSRLIVKVYAR